MKKISDKILSDMKWYLSIRHRYNFDGTAEYFTKKGESIIQYDPKGVSGFMAFATFDSTGRVKPTKHPNILHTLLKSKGSINLHIKMYAESMSQGLMFPFELREIAHEIKAPAWFMDSVNKQSDKYMIQRNYEPMKSELMAIFSRERIGKTI